MRRVWLGIGLAALGLTGCRATAVVSLTVHRGGSGKLAVSLVLDRQAAARNGDLTKTLQTADLQAAGWRLGAPATGPDGSVTETLTHDFRSVAEADRLLATVGPSPGPAAPLRLALSRSRSVGSSRTRMRGTVDLRAGLDAFADAKLVAALSTPSLASALAQLEQEGEAPPALAMDVVARLPGRPVEVVGGGRVQGDTVTWHVPMGSVATLGAAATASQSADMHWLEGAGVSLVVLIVLIGAGWWSARARRHHDRWSLPRAPAT